MADDDGEKSAADGEDVMEFPAVSRVTFDERTGTVTLQLTKNREQRTKGEEGFTNEK